VPKHEDWHFVLVPLAGAKLPDEARRDILWHIADDKTFRLPVAMGEGQGFAWFSHASIPMQYHVRDQLQLAGGDDQLSLMVRGITIDDEGTNTRNSSIYLIPKFGDAGFDALDRTVSKYNESRIDIALAA